MFLKYINRSNNQIATEIKKYGTFIVCECDKCKTIYKRILNSHEKMKKNPLCNADYCRKCWTGILNSRKEYKENMSKSLKEMRKNNPELSIRISNIFKTKKINCGEKNGMKKIESRKKLSETRKQMFESNPELKKLCSIATKKAWENGKFEGVRVGQCKWFDFVSADKINYKVQGTWELAFIKWLDKNKISFSCHKGKIPYKMDGKEKNYYPDFFVNDWNCYVDVKCEHFFDKQKFDAIITSNKDIKIKLLFKKDLLELGVEL